MSRSNLRSSNGRLPAELTVVGVGRIGGMLCDLAADAGLGIHSVGRSGPTTESDGRGPVVVCTRNDALVDVIDRTPPARQRDLVFVQNGVLAPWLAARGLRDCTVGVLYVAVDARGATPVPGAPSVFGGPHAPGLVSLLQGGGVTAQVAADEDALRTAVGTKLAWICVLGVMGEVLACSVGELVEHHAHDIAVLCDELAPVLEGNAATAAAPDLTVQVIEYSRSVAHYRTKLKEWPWRTGWLLDAADAQGCPLPIHREWLGRAGR